MLSEMGAAMLVLTVWEPRFVKTLGDSVSFRLYCS
jgi:hypothetical protein